MNSFFGVRLSGEYYENIPSQFDNTIIIIGWKADESMKVMIGDDDVESFVISHTATFSGVLPNG